MHRLGAARHVRGQKRKEKGRIPAIRAGKTRFAANLRLRQPMPAGIEQDRNSAGRGVNSCAGSLAFGMKRRAPRAGIVPSAGPDGLGARRIGVPVVRRTLRIVLINCHCASAEIEINVLQETRRRTLEQFKADLHIDRRSARVDQ